VNWEHLKTYIWVRWRLSKNQVKRSGSIGVIIAAILAGLRVLGGVVTFIAGLLVGVFALRQAEPMVVMIVWDGVVGAFILFWMIGLMSELQRSELLSLDNFMHLPVSPSGAFLINSLGSSIGLSLILFLPAMTGLAIGLMFSRGLTMLLLFPLIVTFLLMVTAVTYQFRGWLASMMANPRRRRTIIAVVTVLFILVFQLPNLLLNFGPGAKEKRQASQEARKEVAVRDQNLADGLITKEEYEKQLSEKGAVLKEDRELEVEKNYRIVRTVNAAVPPGWLPYGAFAASHGRYFPILACIFGMGLIGVISLQRSYKTSIRLYSGDFNKGRAGRKAETESVFEDVPEIKEKPGRRAAFLEKKLPWMSEQASAVTLMGCRSLIRAPEVKMLLLTPVIMLVVFGGMFASKGGNVSGLLRPLIALGFMAILLILGMTTFVGNQFAFDRSGFRTFVLSCSLRRDILLGKNLSLFPYAIVLMTLIIGVSQWINPMRWDHLAAVLIQMVPMYLLFCLTGNIMSILSPITLKSGSGMPAPHQGIRTLFQMIFMIVLPVPLSFTLIPLGIEALYSSIISTVWVPIFLILSVIQVVVVIWLYRAAINWQGILLHQNEQKILEVVSLKAD